MLVYVFAVNLGWFPTTGMQSAYVEPGFFNSLKDSLHHYVLPVVSITLVGIAGYMRYQRASMLEAIRQDYVRTARAKGLRQSVVVTRHALKNALLPTLTVVGLQVGLLFGGALLVEIVFSWPGIGRYAVQGINQFDYNAVMGTTLIIAFIYVLVNLIVDVLYVVVDPRISYA
jgi:peptide/nickel transport system permease protein